MSQEGKQDKGDDLSDLPALPAKVITKDGQKIDLTSSVWRARTSPDGGIYIQIDWSLTQKQKSQHRILTKRAWYLVKLYLADRLSKRSIRTVRSNYSAFLAFNCWLANQDTLAGLAEPEKGFDWSDYGESIARAFLHHGVNHTSQKGHHFWELRTFYAWGVAHHMPGFSLALLRVLRSIRTTSNLEGHHVRFRDTINGPLSTEEIRIVKQTLDQGQGILHDRIIVRLHYELGINTFAATLLRNSDLHWYEAQGSWYFQLDVPRTKKRLVVRETKRRPISLALGSAFLEIQTGSPGDRLLFWLPEDHPDRGILASMRRFAKVSHLQSPRTKGPLKLNPRRFRYTLATHLAEEGASDLHIAEMLDHSDLRHVKVYRETRSSIAEPMAHATNPVLTPLIHLFLGVIVDPDQSQGSPAGFSQQVIPGAPLHIPQVPLDIGGIGMCGRNLNQDGLCKLFPPLSCYTCSFFAALRTGPHQQLYEGLVAYLAEHQDQLDQRVLLQLEEVLSAIREVLTLIKKPVNNQGGPAHA